MSSTPLKRFYNDWWFIWYNTHLCGLSRRKWMIEKEEKGLYRGERFPLSLQEISCFDLFWKPLCMRGERGGETSRKDTILGSSTSPTYITFYIKFPWIIVCKLGSDSLLIVLHPKNPKSATLLMEKFCKNHERLPWPLLFHALLSTSPSAGKE